MFKFKENEYLGDRSLRYLIFYGLLRQQKFLALLEGERKIKEKLYVFQVNFF